MASSALAVLIDALDGHHIRGEDVKAAESAWKAAQKEAKETYAPLKALLTFKLGAPTSTTILQRSIEAGGELAKTADAYLQEHPREVWRADGDPLPLKNGAARAVYRDADGKSVRAAFGDGKAKLDVYDLGADTLSVAFSLKLDALSCRLVDKDTVRALLKDGKLVEQKNGEKKPRVLHDFGSITDGAVGATHSAALRESADDDGNPRWSVVVDGGSEVALSGVKSAMGPAAIGDVVYVCVANDAGDGGFAKLSAGGAAAASAVEYTWLPRYPSGGTAPPRAENAHQLVVVDGETFLITWGESAPMSRRWVRVKDLSEDARFGPDFENIDAHAGQVWSGTGDRVKDGKRTSPIAFDVRCWSTVIVDADTVVCSVVDAKDKIWLRRFRRHSG